MPLTWSEQLARHYRLQAPDDLRIWWDQELWREPGGGEFRELLSPEQLLDVPPGVIWSGFLPADLLPIAGNHYGDWLALRIGPQGTLKEVVVWRHNGGDWTPYGDTWAEALLTDAALRIDPAEFDDDWSEQPEASLENAQRQAEWAAQQLGQTRSISLPPFWRTPAGDPWKTMQQAGVCQAAASRQRVLRALHSPLKTRCHPQLAERLNTAWEPDFVRGLFDHSQFPAALKELLQESFRLDASPWEAQNWELAETQALEVLKQRRDLGWTFAIAGWSAERRNQLSAAAQWYWKGLQASLFTDDAILLRSHWVGEAVGKFSAARLEVLQEQLSPAQRNDPYLRIFWKRDAENLRRETGEHWLQQARRAAAHNQPLEAYRFFHQAGWDCGLPRLQDYEEVLEGMQSTASQAGAETWARLAKIHRQFL